MSACSFAFDFGDNFFFKVVEGFGELGSEMKEIIQDALPKRVKSIHFGVLSSQEAKKLSVIELYDRSLYDLTKPNRPPAKFGALDRQLGTADKVEKCETCGQNQQDCVGHYGIVRLALPVFHIGYFKMMITVLQNICKSCSRVLLDDSARQSFLKRLRNPNLDGLKRKEVLKNLNKACKKVSRCPHCLEPNGAVKKVGALKVIHEKYKKKTKADDDSVFRASFEAAIQVEPSIKAHISKAQEDLSPIVVLNLLKKVSNEDCELFGMDPDIGRPELFLWTALPVPPVCIRPSVGQENSSNEDDITVLVSEIIFTNAAIKTYLQEGNASFQKIMDLKKIKKGFCQRLKGKHGRFRGNLSGKRVDFSGRTVISPDPNLSIDQVAVPERVAKVLTYPERVTQYNVERLRKNVINGTEKHPGATYIQYQSGIKKFLKYGNREKIAADLRIGDVVDRHIQDGDIVLFNRQPSLHKLSIMSHYVKVRPWKTFRFNECVCTPYNADFDGDEMNLHVPQTEEARTEAIELMGVKNNLVTPRNGEPLIAATQDFITASFLQSKKDVFYDRTQFSQICSYMFDATVDIDLPHPAIIKAPYKTKAGNPVDVSLCPNDGFIVIRNSEIMCGVVDKAIIGDGSKKSLFYAVLRDFGPQEAANCMNRVAKLSARFLANRGFSIGIDDVQPGAKLREEKENKVKAGYDECDNLISQAKSGELQNQPGADLEGTLEASISGVLSKIREDVGNICLTELNKYNAPLIMSLCGSKGSKINVSQMVACVGQQIISGNRIPNGFLDRSLPHFPKNSAKGFVRNSFYSGLSPPEFIFHAVSGREGLVDTAVKTAETGYMQRRLVKALEDLTAHYDGSVRNSTGGIVQLTYGDDGLDPARIESSVYPVEFTRAWLNCTAAKAKPKEKALSSADVKKAIREYKDSIVQDCSETFFEAIIKFFEDNVLSSLQKAEAASSDIGSVKNKVVKSHIVAFIELCRQKYIAAKMEPGTAVGAIGAQSIGEPGTQMTLKTFHFAGVASMNITLGVPRIKEIINASKKIATPIITAQLLPGTNQDERAVRVVKGRIEKTTLEDVTDYIEEIVSSNECAIRLKIDTEAISKLQLEVSLDSIVDSLLRARKLKLTDAKPNSVKVRVIDPKGDKATTFNMMQSLKRQLPKVPIKGIPTVSRAVISKIDPKDSKLQLLVEGSGLLEVMGTEGIEGKQTRSNSIVESCTILGIEAARTKIIDEIVYTMESHGMTIDKRHVMLLADLMTFKGEVLGITRFGIAKMKDSVLMLASFEKTTDHLFEASFHGKKDQINGVSECIIMGIPMGIGSGIFQLLQKCTEKDLVPPPRPLLFGS
ncbi:hypothetical protein HDU97_002595 [Phlyctochytrium planicorne]|nr:hypothetical protein HDU97_002595 [Phlyctochytrium planicorne]